MKRESSNKNRIKNISRTIITLMVIVVVMGMGKSLALAATTVPTVKSVKVSNVTTTSAIIKWSSVKGVKGYQVYRYNSKTKKYSDKIATTSKTQFKITKLKPGSVSFYKVRCYKVEKGKNVYSKFSGEVRVFTNPDKVTGFKYTTVKSDCITLAWNKTTGAAGYYVYGYNFGIKKYEKIASSTKNSVQIKKLNANTRYVYIVKAYAKYKTVYSYGAVSSKVDVYTKPQSIKIISQDKNYMENTVTLSWQGINNVTGYRLYEYDKLNGKWIFIKEIEANLNKYTINGLNPGSEHVYRVRTYIKCSGKYEYDSYPITVNTVTTPSSISNLRANKSMMMEDNATIFWDKANGATGYYIDIYDEESKEYKRAAKVVDVNTYYFNTLLGATKYKCRVTPYKYSNITKKYYSSYDYGCETEFITLVGTGKNLRVDAVSDRSVLFKWDKNETLTGYLIKIYDENDSLLMEDKITATEYRYMVNSPANINVRIELKGYKEWNDPELDDLEEYTISLAKTCIDASNEIAQVQNVVRKSYTKDTLQIIWDEVANAQKYEVYEIIDDSEKLVGETDKTEYIVANLEAGTIHEYKVRAYSKDLDYSIYGDYSNVITMATKYAAPNNFQLNFNSENKQIELAWDKVKDNIGYVVYRYDMAKKQYVKYATVDKNITTYVDNNIQENNYYKYKVIAYVALNNINYYGEYSTEIIGVTGNYGIDVSEYQGNIDWKKVRNSGVNFAIIKACKLNGDSQIGENGTKQIENPYFKKNIEGAIKEGIHVGVYVYSYANDTNEAVKEAEFVLSLIENYDITYPVYYDLERNVGSKIINTYLAVAFCKKIKAAGYIPGVYTGAEFFVNNMDMTKLSDYDIWAARYIYKTQYNYPTDMDKINSYLDKTFNYNVKTEKLDKYTSIKLNMWQYSTNGKIAGINAPVDLNYSYKW